jgi:hypothetical protein
VSDDEQRQRYDDAIAEQMQATQRVATAQATPPIDLSKKRADGFRSKAEALKHARRKLDSTAFVPLPGLSVAAGEEIRVKVKRLTPQQILVTNSLPASGIRFTNALIRAGVQATEKARIERGLDSPVQISDEDVQRAIEKEYGEFNQELASGWTQFLNAVVCNAVIDDEVHFYMTVAEADADNVGFFVDDLPDSDKMAVYSWAMVQEEQAVQSVATFPAGRSAVVPPVREDQVVQPSAFGPGSV